MTIDEGFGARARAARERKGLTQEVAAEQLQMHMQTLSKIERGRQKSVRADLLSRMADLYGVTERWLVTGVSEEERQPTVGAQRDSLQLGALLAMQRARRAVDQLMDDVIAGAVIRWAEEEAARAPGKLPGAMDALAEVLEREKALSQALAQSRQAPGQETAEQTRSHV